MISASVHGQFAMFGKEVERGMQRGHLNLREIPRMGQVSNRFRRWSDTGSSVMWKNVLETALSGDIDNFSMSAVKFMCNASPEKLRGMLGAAWCRVQEVATPSEEAA
jgi:hypothetical protein